MAIDGTWAALLPHAALKSTWLGSHGVLHSYFPIAGNALPNSSASSNLSFLSQPDLSSVLSIAMAPNRMEKVKKPLSSASSPLAVEPAVPSSGWDHEKLASPRLAFVWLRLKRLKDLVLTAPMVMKEFLRSHVAPLQRHSHLMWALFVGQDRMRLQESGLPLEA